MTAAEEKVRYGFTLADLDTCAHHAVARARAQTTDYRDRYDAAWHAIAELLYSSCRPVDAHTLKAAGIAAVNRLVQDELHHHGVDRNTAGSGRESMRGYWRYWWDAARITPSPEDRIVEGLAVQQILDALSTSARAAILELAARGDYLATADVLDVGYHTLTSRVRSARLRLLRLWYEGETPPPWRRDRRVGAYGSPLSTHCSAGHERTPENTRIRYRTGDGRTKTERVCRVCESERSIVRTRTRREAVA